jgi:hypothetical protein
VRSPVYFVALIVLVAPLSAQVEHKPTRRPEGLVPFGGMHDGTFTYPDYRVTFEVKVHLAGESILEKKVTEILYDDETYNPKLHDYSVQINQGLGYTITVRNGIPSFQFRNANDTFPKIAAGEVYKIAGKLVLHSYALKGSNDAAIQTNESLIRSDLPKYIALHSVERDVAKFAMAALELNGEDVDVGRARAYRWLAAVGSTDELKALAETCKSAISRASGVVQREQMEQSERTELGSWVAETYAQDLNINFLRPAAPDPDARNRRNRRS